MVEDKGDGGRSPGDAVSASAPASMVWRDERVSIGTRLSLATIWMKPAILWGDMDYDF